MQMILIYKGVISQQTHCKVKLLLSQKCTQPTGHHSLAIQFTKEFMLFPYVIPWLTGTYGSVRCPELQESTMPDIATWGEDQNSKSEV
jgi:hypothetical protein